MLAVVFYPLVKSFIVKCDYPPNGSNGLKGVNGLNGINGLNGLAVFSIGVSGFQNRVRPLKSLNIISI